MPVTYPDVWEAIADAIPDAPAVIQGDLVRSWGDYDDRSARLAAAFSAADCARAVVGARSTTAPRVATTTSALAKPEIVGCRCAHLQACSNCDTARARIGSP